MNILILAMGTRGDLELFLALGRTLQARGHLVMLASSAAHAGLVGGSGLGWEAVAGSDLDEIVGVLRSLAGVLDGRARTLGFYQRWLQPRLAEALPNVVRLAGRSDYFVSNLKIVLSRGDGVMPGASVTYDPPAELTDLARYGTREYGGRVLDLVAMPRGLVDPTGAWDPAFRFTGFWHNPSRLSPRPSTELADFVEGGSPPVVLTMGSMAMLDPERLARVFAGAIGRIGRRGVLAAGWSGMAPGLRADGPLFVAGEVPYDWLFPRSACLIHHGGAGTVASALRAGKVSILLPQILAQEHFARALKLAPKDAEILCDRGYGLYLRHRWADAEVMLKSALAAEPSLARAHANLALVLARQGDDPGALAEFARAGVDPSDARSNLALVMATEGRLEDSRREYTLALASKPGSARAKEGLKATTVALAGKADLRAIATNDLPPLPVDPAVMRTSAPAKH